MTGLAPAPTTGQRIRFTLLLAAAAVAGIALARCDANAQEPHAGHSEFHDVYKTWMMPDAPHVSCCNAKYDEAGHLLAGGDCYPTEAELRQEVDHETGKKRLAWWAKRDTGEWIPIPEVKRLREINPDDTGSRAHLCEKDGYVFCFVPPVGGV